MGLDRIISFLWGGGLPKYCAYDLLVVSFTIWSPSKCFLRGCPVSLVKDGGGGEPEIDSAAREWEQVVSGNFVI
jgi:hypothetical protein